MNKEYKHNFILYRAKCLEMAATPLKDWCLSLSIAEPAEKYIKQAALEIDEELAAVNPSNNKL